MVSYQWSLDELTARAAILENGGEIVELSAAERRLFIDAVAPVYDEFASRYPARLRRLIGL